MPQDGQKRRFTVLTSIYNVDSIPYLAKLLSVVSDLEIEAEFWCWDRKRIAQGNDWLTPKIHRRVLLSGGGEHNKGLLVWYPLWTLRLFFAVLFGGRGRLFFCSNLESALPAAIASVLGHGQFIFANRDNVSKSYRWPGPVRKLIEWCEKFTARRAVAHLIPGACRWPYNDNNLRIIPNTPTSQTLQAAERIARDKNYGQSEKLTVYINGWLTETRGIETFLKATRLLRTSNIRIIIAGPTRCAEALELIERDDVTYLGTLPTDQSLALYFDSDLVFTFYDPAIEINRLAEPNKWQDCIAVGTPFVVNSEVETAKPFMKNDACLTVGYHDSVALADLLETLAQDRKVVDKVRTNLKRFQIPLWDQAIKSLLTESLLLDSVAIPSTCEDSEKFVPEVSETY